MVVVCWLHCALSLAAQCIVIGPVCVFATGGRAVSEPYYSQRAQCLRLSGRFFIFFAIVCTADSYLYVKFLVLLFFLFLLAVI